MYKRQEYERYELTNGMVVYLMEDHQLPLVKGSALIKTGSRLEPAPKVGLAQTTGSLMRLGGNPTTFCQRNKPTFRTTGG